MQAKLASFTYVNDQKLDLTMYPLEVQNAETRSHTSITAYVFVFKFIIIRILRSAPVWLHLLTLSITTADSATFTQSTALKFVYVLYEYIRRTLV